MSSPKNPGISGSSFEGCSRFRFKIYAASYARPQGPPNHWTIVVTPSKKTDEGLAFQIVHGCPIFTYNHKEHVTLNGSDRLLKSVKLGVIEESKLDTIKEAMGNVAINNADEDWNCQSWTKDAVLALEELEMVEQGSAEKLDEGLA